MKLLIDHADVSSIREICDYYPIDGVTTNPSILSRAGRPPFEVLKEIRQILGPDRELHVQAIALDASGIVEDAHAICRVLGEGTFVKVPCVPEGFKAMKQLNKEGIRITGTVVYTPLQAYLASRCGAAYVAPYINRLDNMGYDGVGLTRKIQDILDGGEAETEILAASFKNSQQVLELCAYGVGAATVAPDIIRAFARNDAVEAAVKAFSKDFERLAGVGKTMSSCE